MYHKLEFSIHKSTALSVLKYLNNLDTNKEDMKRVKRFFTRVRGDVAEIVNNQSDVLKEYTRKGIHIAPDNPIK